MTTALYLGATEAPVQLGSASVTGVIDLGVPPWLHNVDSDTLSTWAAATEAADAGSGRAKLIFIGDSITQGYYGTAPYYTNSFVNQVQASIDARTGVPSGTGMVTPWESATTVPPGPAETRWGRVGTVTDFLGSVGMLGFCFLISGTSNKVTFGPVTADRFTVTWAAGGAFDGFSDVLIDDVSVGSVALDHTFAIHSQTFAAVSEGSHTLTLVGPNTAQSGIIVAVEAGRSGTATGISTSRIAQTGARASKLSANATAADSLSSCFSSSPHLSCIMFGTNDATAAIAQATYRSQLTTAVAKGQLTGDVILIVPPPPNTATVSQVNWELYRESIYVVADANGCGVIDMTIKWVSRAASLSFYYDNVHPNPAGQADIASTIFSGLTATIPVGS